MKKVLESKTKIRFQDCDPFNHLNNSKYIDYFINAREDQIIAEYAFDIHKHTIESGKSWVVTSNQIVYLKPALLMEEVIIDSQLIDFTQNSLKTEMRMWNKDKTILKSIFWNKYAYFDLNEQRKADHSIDLTDLFDSTLKPIEVSSFEDRCFQLIQTQKLNKKT